MHPSRRFTPIPVALKRLLTVVVALASFMVGNALFLVLVRLAGVLGLEWVTGEVTALPEFFQLMVLAHTGAGVALAAVAFVFFVSHLCVEWQPRRGQSPRSGAALAVAGLVLAVTGLFILTESANRGNRWPWWLHVCCALSVLLAYARHRYLGRARPTSARVRRFAISSVSAAAKAVAIELNGMPPNRHAIGALVSLFSGVTVQRRMVRTGSSYLSQSDYRTILFGLEPGRSVDSLEVRWPTTGHRRRFGSFPAGKRYSITEMTDRIEEIGLVGARPSREPS